MRERSLWSLLLSIVLALPLLAAAANEPAERARHEALRALEDWAARDFALPADLELDAPLRQQAEALIAAHRTLLSRLFGAWLAEEQALLEPRAPSRELSSRVVARYLNELALWQLDTSGEAFDRVMLRAFTDTGACRNTDPRPPFAAWLQAVQRMAVADRTVALEAQGVLLARWGEKRSDAPLRPAPSLVELAIAAAPALRRHPRPADEPPMPPVLAWTLLQATPRALPPVARCVALAWQLQRAPTRDASLAEQVAAARYAVMIDVAELFRAHGEADVNTDAYPRVARMFGVEGSVRVRGRVRENSQGLDTAAVEARRITVPGIRDARPVAFETLFDLASIARAATTPIRSAGPGAESPLTIVWRLE